MLIPHRIMQFMPFLRILHFLQDLIQFLIHSEHFLLHLVHLLKGKFSCGAGRFGGKEGFEFVVAGYGFTLLGVVVALEGGDVFHDGLETVVEVLELFALVDGFGWDEFGVVGEFGVGFWRRDFLWGRGGSFGCDVAICLGCVCCYDHLEYFEGVGGFGGCGGDSQLVAAWENDFRAFEADLTVHMDFESSAGVLDFQLSWAA